MTISTKIILDVDTIPRVDIDFMNNTHFEEVEMVKDLGELITAYQKQGTCTENEKTQITTLLENWLEHTQAHFSRENELMIEINFPAYSIHFSEHEAALSKITDIIGTWKIDGNIDPVAEFIFFFWPAWFDGHVNSMDMMTAKIAVMGGYDPYTQS